ncbi:hypothetical protein BDV11DRAFT_20231 [Aspergillus similis]
MQRSICMQSTANAGSTRNIIIIHYLSCHGDTLQHLPSPIPDSLRAGESSGSLFLLNWTTGTGANAVELELAGPAYISASYLSVMSRPRISFTVSPGMARPYNRLTIPHLGCEPFCIATGHSSCRIDGEDSGLRNLPVPSLDLVGRVTLNGVQRVQ